MEKITDQNPYLKPGFMLRQSNIITSSRFEFSALEMDFLQVLLIEMRNKKFEGNTFYLFPENLKWITAGRNYRIIDLAQTFAKRVARFETTRNDGKKGVTVAALFSSATFFNDQIEIVIDPRVMDFYRDLTKYTEYELRTSLSVSSKYTKKLYQLLSQYKSAPPTFGNKPVYTVTVFNLKTLLGIIPPMNDYSLQDLEKLEKDSPLYRWSDFKRYALEAPAAELKSAGADLSFTWWPSMKKGKKITHLSFEITKVQRETAFTPEQTAAVEWLILQGLNQSQAKEITRNIEYTILAEQLRKLAVKFTEMNEQDQPKINNPAGFIVNHYERFHNLSLKPLNTGIKE